MPKWKTHNTIEYTEVTPQKIVTLEFDIDMRTSERDDLQAVVDEMTAKIDEFKGLKDRPLKL